MKIINKIVYTLMILGYVTACANEPKNNNTTCSYCPFLSSVEQFHKTMSTEFTKMQEHMHHAFKQNNEPVPVECTISQDDDFIYLKLKSSDLKDSKIESHRTGSEIVLTIDSSELKINAWINEYRAQVNVEKNEKKEESYATRKYKQINSLPTKVDLKNVEIKKQVNENCVIVKLEKNELEKTYRIQVIEE